MIRPNTESLRHRAHRRHVLERQKLYRRATPHLREIGKHAGNVRGHRRWRRPVNYTGADAAPALDELFAGQLTKRTPHGSPRYGVKISEFVFGW